MLFASGTTSKIARQPWIASSGRAEVVSMRPFVAVTTASTLVFGSSSAKLPPAKSTAKRHENALRSKPITPPMPVRVATVRASGGCTGASRPQNMR